MSVEIVHIIFTTTGTVVTQGLSFSGPQILFYKDRVEIRAFYDTEGIFQDVPNLERKKFQVIGPCQAIIDETTEATFYNEEMCKI